MQNGEDMQNYIVRGPAVGIENGTLLIGWAARLKGDTAQKFNLMPLAARWTERGTLRVIVLRPDGSTANLNVLELQFDPDRKSAE